MKLPTLYQLTDEFLVAQAQLFELDVPDEVVRDTLESLQYPVEQKAIAVAQMVRNFEAQRDAIKAAIADMESRAKAMNHRAEKLRSYLFEQMMRSSIKKIPSPYFDVKLVQNPPAVVIGADAKIPDRFMRIPPVPMPEPDKKAIKAALEAGEDIPGCEIQRSLRLEIK